MVLDLGSGTCYGSSILRRGGTVKRVVSVDIDEDFVKYGKIVYGIEDCVVADATSLPFRNQCFDTVVSIETIEHTSGKALLDEVRSCLRAGGTLVLSTPNKLYSSPFVPRPLNPYHMKEYYLGQLLALLQLCGFKPIKIYGGRKVSGLELIRRIFGSLLKFMLTKFSITPYAVDNVYHALSNLITKRKEKELMVDPSPNLFMHEELKPHSNITLYQYFIIFAIKS